MTIGLLLLCKVCTRTSGVRDATKRFGWWKARRCCFTSRRPKNARGATQQGLYPQRKASVYPTDPERTQLGPLARLDAGVNGRQLCELKGFSDVINSTTLKKLPHSEVHQVRRQEFGHQGGKHPHTDWLNFSRPCPNRYALWTQNCSSSG